MGIGLLKGWHGLPLHGSVGHVTIACWKPRHTAIRELAGAASGNSAPPAWRVALYAMKDIYWVKHIPYTGIIANVSYVLKPTYLRGVWQSRGYAVQVGLAAAAEVAVEACSGEGGSRGRKSDAEVTRRNGAPPYQRRARALSNCGHPFAQHSPQPAFLNRPA